MVEKSFQKTIKRCLLVAAIFLLQFVFADKCRIVGVAPNFALCFVLTVSFLREQQFSFYAALALGLLMDSVSGQIFGVYSVWFMIIALGVRELYHSAFSENFVIEALYGLLICALYSVSFAFFISLFRGEFLFLLSRIVWIEALYNFAVFLVMLSIQKKSQKKYRSMFRI